MMVKLLGSFVRFCVRTLPLTILLTFYLFSQGFSQLTWSPTSLINGPTENRPFAKVVCDPTDPDIVWALTSNIPDPTSSTVDPAQGVYRSTDRGVNWIQVNDGVLLQEINALDIAISHIDSDVAYIATNVEGIFKTIDGGQTWTVVNSGITHNSSSFPNPTWAALAIAVDPSDHNYVYCGVANANNIDYLSGSGDHPGFYKSTDGGASWVARNSGLPSRYDPIDLFDSVSHTVTVASIAVIPQNPNIVLIGISDHEVNVALFGDRTARSKGRMFYSTNKASGSWTELSSGLPEISQGGGTFDLARASFSQLHITANPAGPIGLYSSHLGGTAIIYIDTAEAKSKSKGVYKFEGGSWARRSSGLPVVTDDFSEGATNAGPVTISPANPNVLLVGISFSDSGDPTADLSKVYASVNGASTWIRNWDSGMSDSPNFGFTESNPGFVSINLDQSAAFASVIWGDGAGSDDGIYRLPPP
jgi:hypothetical protein